MMSHMNCFNCICIDFIRRIFEGKSSHHLYPCVSFLVNISDSNAGKVQVHAYANPVKKDE